MSAIKNVLVIFCAVVPLGLVGGLLLAFYDEWKERRDVEKRKRQLDKMMNF